MSMTAMPAPTVNARAITDAPAPAVQIMPAGDPISAPVQSNAKPPVGATGASGVSAVDTSGAWNL